MFDKNMYKEFSEIYRQLLLKRNHFKNQFYFLQTFINKYFAFNNSIKILDLASGTGDVLFKLFNHGYKNIYGIDGESSMIKKSNNHVKRKITHLNWNKLNHYSQRNFDLIYCLGNSISHANYQLISNIMEWCFDSLNDNSYFIFDCRKWEQNKEGKYIEKKRVPGVKRSLGKVKYKGYLYSLFERVTYDFNKYSQSIKYILKDDSEILLTVLQYYIYPHDFLVSKLIKQTFNDIMVVNKENWPYVIYILQK